MQRTALALALCTAAIPALAQCPPPPLPSLEQFHVACNAQIAGGYFQGGWNQRMSPLDYEMMMYQRTYGVAARPNFGGGYNGGGYNGGAGPAMGVCSLGQAQCFNGYVRRCEVMPNGTATWWVTSGQSCR